MMSEKEFIFHSNQSKTPQLGRCSSFVDRKWQISQMKQMKRQNRVRDQCTSKVRHQATEEDHAAPISVNESDDENATAEYNILPDNTDGPSKKKQRYVYADELDHPDDDLPFKYRHIRSGLRKVKPEFWTVKSILQSEYHMSDEQSDGAITVVANHLFGRKEFGEWKKHAANEETTNNTLPAHSNRRRVEVRAEAMALSTNC